MPYYEDSLTREQHDEIVRLKKQKAVDKAARRRPMSDEAIAQAVGCDRRTVGRHWKAHVEGVVFEYRRRGRRFKWQEEEARQQLKQQQQQQPLPAPLLHESLEDNNIDNNQSNGDDGVAAMEVDSHTDQELDMDQQQRSKIETAFNTDQFPHSSTVPTPMMHFYQQRSAAQEMESQHIQQHPQQCLIQCQGSATVAPPPPPQQQQSMSFPQQFQHPNQPPAVFSYQQSAFSQSTPPPPTSMYLPVRAEQQQQQPFAPGPQQMPPQQQFGKGGAASPPPTISSMLMGNDGVKAMELENVRINQGLDTPRSSTVPTPMMHPYQQPVAQKMESQQHQKDVVDESNGNIGIDGELHMEQSGGENTNSESSIADDSENNSSFMEVDDDDDAPQQADKAAVPAKTETPPMQQNEPLQQQSQPSSSDDIDVDDNDEGPEENWGRPLRRIKEYGKFWTLMTPDVVWYGPGAAEEAEGYAIEHGCSMPWKTRCRKNNRILFPCRNNRAGCKYQMLGVGTTPVVGPRTGTMVLRMYEHGKHAKHAHRASQQQHQNPQQQQRAEGLRRNPPRRTGKMMQGYFEEDFVRVMEMENEADDFEVFWVSDSVGRGIRTRVPFKKGQPLLNYHAEQVSKKEFYERKEKYDAAPLEYGSYTYETSYGPKLYFDATFPDLYKGKSLEPSEYTGSYGRLVNHADAEDFPNCAMKRKHYDGKDVLVLEALDDIDEGEELRYDYGDPLLSDSFDVEK